MKSLLSILKSAILSPAIFGSAFFGLAMTLSLSTPAWSDADLSAHQTILFIGDSHSAGTFGHQLDEKLRSMPDTTEATYASCGSAAASWFNHWVTPCGYFEHNATGGKVDVYPSNQKTPYLPDLLDHLRPTWTVVALGSNQILGGPDYGAGSIRKLMQTIRDHGSQCIWVGAPHSRVFPAKGLQGFYDTIAQAGADIGCSIIDSRPSSPYAATGGDGMHYDSFPGGRQIAIQWAQAVFEQITAWVSGQN